MRAHLPRTSDVRSATLHLYNLGTGDSTQDLAVRRMRGVWTDDVNWDTSDGTTSWDLSGSGADAYDDTADDTVSVDGTSAGWETWNVTDTVDGWVSGGHAQRGLIVTADPGIIGDVSPIAFASSEAGSSTAPISGHRLREARHTARLLVDKFSITDRSSMAVDVAHGNLMLARRISASPARAWTWGWSATTTPKTATPASWARAAASQRGATSALTSVICPGTPTGAA